MGSNPNIGMESRVFILDTLKRVIGERLKFDPVEHH